MVPSYPHRDRCSERLNFRFAAADAQGVGKHSNGRARGAEPVTATTEDAPAPVAFSGWLPPPPADRVQPLPVPEPTAPVMPAPAPVLFSEAPSPLELMAAPVAPVPAARPAIPALAEA